MNHHSLLRRAGVLSAAAAGVVLAITPASAEMPASALSPVAISQSALGAATRASAVPASAVPSPAAAATAPAACAVAPAQARFDYPLTRTGRRLAAGLPLKIVALGSSSTAGAGASSPSASYPSQLASELRKRFPSRDVTVLNRGINGEEVPEMLARFENSVVAERPDLVIWQIGTNWVLRDRPLDARAIALHDGLARLKAIRADVVLIDPQFVPKVINKPGTEGMVAQIATTAKAENVDLFHRFAVMRHWREVENLPFDTFVSPDGLHMNDWGYACLAKELAFSIAEAATRPTATAHASARAVR